MKNDGGPAFPQPCTEGGYAANTPYSIAGGGMSLRDYFAAKAMQGLLSNPYYMNEMYKYWNGDNLKIRESICKSSFDCADAMLKAREEK